MTAPSDDMEMEKIAEDELSKLQRQFRVMEIDRATVMSSVQPTLRVQRNIIKTLNADLEKIMMELKLTKSTSNVMENVRIRDKLVSLLKEHERFSTEVREHRGTISELDFLLKQVQKEIKGLKAKGTGCELEYAKTLTNQTMLSQLENRLDTAMKKFNTVNSENYKMRVEIDKLLRDRQFFNLIWRNQLKRLMDGKTQILELVEQAITAYDQREEWCTKLEALKEKAAIDYRKHCMEVRELQRQLDHSLKLEEFLRTKGTVRLTAADAKAEAKRLEQQEEEMRAYNNYVNVLDAIREFTGEEDVDKLIQEFTRREEENYALFNYINEVNTELKNLSDNVRMLQANIEDERAKHQAKLYKQQDSIESLRATLEERRASTEEARAAVARSELVLAALLQQIQALAIYRLWLASALYVNDVRDQQVPNTKRNYKQQDSIESLQATLEERRASTEEARAAVARSELVLAALLQQIQALAIYRLWLASALYVNDVRDQQVPNTKRNYKQQDSIESLQATLEERRASTEEARAAVARRELVLAALLQQIQALAIYRLWLASALYVNDVRDQQVPNTKRNYKQQDSIESLQATLEERRASTEEARAAVARSELVLAALLQQIQALAIYRLWLASALYVNDVRDQQVPNTKRNYKQQDSIESLQATLEERRASTEEARAAVARSELVLAALLQQIQALAIYRLWLASALYVNDVRDQQVPNTKRNYKQQDSIESLQATLEERRASTEDARASWSSECNSLPLMKLLGKSFGVSETNARLYIKSLEKKVMEIVEVIKIEEAWQRAAEGKERTPPSSRRRRKPAPSPRAPRHKDAPQIAVQA
ncbi:uncharacterized protein LOC135082496 [Ostrinia nubilalis]|uniref:uncharacterized protein LOC135082496 n=1 Tax=Ostrinia nubilalis TaxID=29057 RepID=UPI003082485A